MPKSKNLTVSWAVIEATYYEVKRAICRIVRDSVRWIVNDAVHDAVCDAVDDAVSEAVRRSVSENPHHPALKDFLQEAGNCGSKNRAGGPNRNGDG